MGESKLIYLCDNIKRGTGKKLRQKEFQIVFFICYDTKLSVKYYNERSGFGSKTIFNE